MTDVTMNEVRLTLEGVPGEPLIVPDIPTETTSLFIDLGSMVRPVTLASLPHTIKQLTIGMTLANSLSGVQLPQYIETYYGPILHDTRLPITLKKLTYVQTFSSIDIERVVIPSGVMDVNIIAISRTMSIDKLNIPASTLSLSVEGPFNTSIDQMDMKNITNLSMPPTFHQPFGGEVGTEGFGFGTMTNSIPVISGKEGMDQLMKHLPSLNHLHVILNDEIKDLWEVWTKVLFEGMVRVRYITIDASRVSSRTNVLKDAYHVIDRSYELGRPISRKMCVRGLRYNMEYEVSYYKIGQSLRNLHNIEIILSHDNPVSNIIPSIASMMGVESNRVDENLGHVYYHIFGAVSTQIYISNGSSIVLDKGEGPIHRVGVETQEAVKSSFAPMNNDEEDIDIKPIILYSWTRCGYCKQQEEIVDRFKSQSEENSDLFG